MKFCVLLLLTITGVCLASPRACLRSCPSSYYSVCASSQETTIYFASQCLLDFYKCLTGKEFPVVPEALCKGHSINEGRRFIDLFLMNGGHLDSSESDESSSSSE